MATPTDTLGVPPPPSQAGRDTSEMLSRRTGPALCVVSAGLIALSAARSGGYFPDTYVLWGVAALLASSVGLVLMGPRWRPAPLETLLLCSLVAYSAWAGLSATWSPDPGGAALSMLRGFGYAAGFLLAMLAVRHGRHAGLLLRLVVGVLVGICVAALISRLRPSAFAVDDTLISLTQGRLAYPLGYWNALGAIGAMAIMGCLGLAADAREGVVTRAAAAAGGTIAVYALYLTLSRGAGLALVAALAVVLGLSPRRLRLAATGLVVLGAGALGAVVLQAHPMLVDRPSTLAQQSSQGTSVLLPLLAIAAAAALAQVGLARVPMLNRHGRPGLQYGRVSRGMAYGVPVAAVVVALVGVYATSSDVLEGRAAQGTTRLRLFVDQQYGAFMDTSKPPPAGQRRLSSARSSRSEAYRVAINGFKQHPLKGDGAAGYSVRWFRERKVPEDFRNAHSLELETASELGLTGLILLSGILGPLGGGLRRIRGTRGGLTRSQAAGAGGVVVVWIVHSALDWDWQMGSVTLPALTCGAVLLAAGPPARKARRRRVSQGPRRSAG